MAQPIKEQKNTAEMCRVAIADGSSAEFTINRNDMLLKSALDQGIDYPHNCRVGVCGKCKTKLISGKVSHMVDLALSPLSNQEIEDGYFLACQGKVRGDLEIDISLGKHNIIPEQIVSGRVSLWKRLPGDVIELRVALDSPLQFQAGQYCTMSESGSFVRRCFSFYDEPPVDGQGATEVGFLIKRLPGGQFSEWLFEADRIGTKLWIHGPYGLMGVEGDERDGLCVAGGTGLAPILSILSERISKSQQSNYTLVFGVRSQQDLFAMDKLHELAESSQGRLTIIPVLSHEPTSSDWPGARGMVTDAINQQLIADFRNVNAFICGSLPMVEAVEKKLTSLGMPLTQIHADKFLPTG